MTRVLVLGGTGWLGREITRTALAGGPDVIDLAAWVVSAGTAATTGVIDAISAGHPMDEFFEMACAATDFGGDLIAVDDDSLLAHDVRY